MRLFAFFYFLTLFFLYLLSLPLILFLSRKQKYKESLFARFFLYKNRQPTSGGTIFHACSLGEVSSLEPLLEHFENKTITTITKTGFDEATKLSNEVRYLPFEILLPFWFTPQERVVVLEAELWFMLFFIAKNKGSKTILLNGRMSDRSFPRYLKFSSFYKMIFKNIDLVIVQSQKDKERFSKLGAKNIDVFGNIKLLKKPKTTKEFTKPKGVLVCGASTHEGEEEPILVAFLELKKQNPDSKLVIAPRHPERFEFLSFYCGEFAQKNNLTFSTFGQTAAFESDINLLDTLGDLINLYAISDIVVLGGAFAAKGGHNPIEPAYFGCKLISGLNIFNQISLFENIEGYTLCSADELKDVLLRYESLPKSFIKERASLERLLELIKQP